MKGSSSFPKVPVILSKESPKGHHQSYNQLYSAKNHHISSSYKKPFSSMKKSKKSASIMSKTVQSFRKFSKSHQKRNGSDRSSSFNRKYEQFRIRTEPSPRKVHPNYKRVNYLKELHILPDKKDRIRVMKKKDDSVLKHFKRKMNNEKIDEKDIVRALKNTTEMKNKIKILDAAVNYKQIEEVQKQKVKKNNHFKKSILLVLQFVNKLKLKARQSRIAKNLQIGKHGEGRKRSVLLQRQLSPKKKIFDKINSSLNDGSHQKWGPFDENNNLNNTVAIIKLEKSGNASNPNLEPEGQNILVESIEDFANFNNLGENPVFQRTASGISQLYQKQSSIPNLNQIDNQDYQSREESTEKLDQILEEESEETPSGRLHHYNHIQSLRNITKVNSIVELFPSSKRDSHPTQKGVAFQKVSKRSFSRSKKSQRTIKGKSKRKNSKSNASKNNKVRKIGFRSKTVISQSVGRSHKMTNSKSRKNEVSKDSLLNTEHSFQRKRNRKVTMSPSKNIISEIERPIPYNKRLNSPTLRKVKLHYERIRCYRIQKANYEFRVQQELEKMRNAKTKLKSNNSNNQQFSFLDKPSKFLTELSKTSKKMKIKKIEFRNRNKLVKSYKNANRHLKKDLVLNLKQADMDLKKTMQMPVLVEEMRPESFYDLQRIDKKMEGKFLQNCFDEIQANQEEILLNLKKSRAHLNVSPIRKAKKVSLSNNLYRKGSQEHIVISSPSKQQMMVIQKQNT